MSVSVLIRLLVFVALLVLQVGFALGAQAPVDLPGQAESVCVPPGLPPYATWRPGDHAEPMVLEDAQHRPYAIAARTYTAAGGTIMTWWLNGALIVVDPAPKDPNAPGWFDDGLVNQDWEPRGPDARPSCRWIQPPPKAGQEAHGHGT